METQLDSATMFVVVFSWKPEVICACADPILSRAKMEFEVISDYILNVIRRHHPQLMLHVSWIRSNHALVCTLSNSFIICKIKTAKGLKIIYVDQNRLKYFNICTALQYEFYNTGLTFSNVLPTTYENPFFYGFHYSIIKYKGIVNYM